MRAPLFILALGLASALPAAFSLNSSAPLGPRAAGLAGADAAAPQSLEAMLGNPASLPEGAELLASYYGGIDPKRLSHSFALGSSLKPDLRLGIFYQSTQDQRLDLQTEQSLALAASLELNPRLSVGARFKGEQLDSSPLSSSVRGLGLDLGLRQSLLQLPWAPGFFSLAAAVDDVAGSWPSQAWANSLPAVARLGAGWQIRPGIYLGFERAWARAQQLESDARASWRAGFEWQALKNLTLRGGWRDDRGNLFSAGLGVSIPWLNSTAQYAMLIRPESPDPSHRFSLELNFARRRGGDLSVKILQLLRNPENQNIRRARFEITVDPALRASAWKLDIIDRDGLVARTLTPLSSSASAIIEWDGRDYHASTLRLDSELKTLLSVETPSGALTLESDMTLDRELQKAELHETVAEADISEFAAPILVPVFDKAGGGKIANVLVKMPETKKLKVEAWKLDFNDSQEHLLRRLEGEGELPSEVVWDGKNTTGESVEDTLGVQVKLELQKESGQKVARSMPLFSQKAYEIAHREAKARPALQLANLGLPLLLNRAPLTWVENDAQALADEAGRRESLSSLADGAKAMASGTTVFLDLFPSGDSAISLEEEAKLKPLLQSLSADSKLTLVISGLSRKDEQNHPGLAGRRAMEMVKRLQSYGAQGLQIVLKTPEEYENAKGVRLEVR